MTDGVLTSMFGNLRFEEFAPVHVEALERALFVCTHEPKRLARLCPTPSYCRCVVPPPAHPQFCAPTGHSNPHRQRRLLRFNELLRIAIRYGVHCARGPIVRGESAAYPRISIVTGARPEIPIARAAAGVRSMMRPRRKGPRSFMRTTTLHLLRLLVTRTRVPNGRVRCAAVKALGEARSPWSNS
jgi:hypothetical protein